MSYGSARIEEAIIDCPIIGICKLDMPKIKKMYDKKCFISKWEDDYRLYRQKTKNILTAKVNISRNDAEELIDSLKLLEVKSKVFRGASTFYYRVKQISVKEQINEM